MKDTYFYSAKCYGREKTEIAYVNGFFDISGKIEFSEISEVILENAKKVNKETTGVHVIALNKMFDAKEQR